MGGDIHPRSCSPLRSSPFTRSTFFFFPVLVLPTAVLIATLRFLIFAHNVLVVGLACPVHEATVTRVMRASGCCAAPCFAAPPLYPHCPHVWH